VSHTRYHITKTNIKKHAQLQKYRNIHVQKFSDTETSVLTLDQIITDWIPSSYLTNNVKAQKDKQNDKWNENQVHRKRQAIKQFNSHASHVGNTAPKPRIILTEFNV